MHGFRELLCSCLFTSGKPREIHQENESKSLLVKDNSLDSCRGRSKDNEGSQLMVVHNFQIKKQCLYHCLCRGQQKVIKLPRYSKVMANQ